MEDLRAGMAAHFMYNNERLRPKKLFAIIGGKEVAYNLCVTSNSANLPSHSSGYSDIEYLGIGEFSRMELFSSI